MAAIGNTYATLADLKSRMVDGQVEKAIIELLEEQGEFLKFLPWVECNDGTQHKTTVRAGIPEPTWRKLNYGVAQKKSQTAQITDACGMMAEYSTIDAKLCELAGKNEAAFRMSEDKGIIQGFEQTLMSAILYGDSTLNPEKIMGLSPRFNALTGVESAENIIDCEGASSNCTSIWLAVLGPESVCGLYPQGTKAGLQHKELGEQTVYDANNNPYQAKRALYQWDVGLCVRDWRQIAVARNIDVDDLTKDASGGTVDLVDVLDQLVERVNNLNVGKPVILANRTIRTFLRRQVKNRANCLLSMDEVMGFKNKVLHFDGIPILRTDALLSTETAIS